MRRIIEAVGPVRITYREPSFETLVRSIVFQQLSGKVASVIFARVEAAVPGGRLTPAAILKLRPSQMRRLGLSSQKTTYIRDLARKTQKAHLQFDRLHAMQDEEVVTHLTAVKGVGTWTAQMFLLFALRRPDVMPTGDLGIRSAIRRAYGLSDLPSPEKIDEIARPWRPYCSIATWYLWRSLEA